MICDLHLHSNYSIDGRGDISELSKIMNNTEVSVISITDHNTLAHHSEVSQYFNSHKQEVLYGSEISCTSAITGNFEFHVLAYWNKKPERVSDISIFNLCEQISSITERQFDHLINEYSPEEMTEILSFWTAYKSRNLKESVARHPFILTLYNREITDEKRAIDFRERRRSLKKQLATSKDWPQFPPLEEVFDQIIKTGGIPVLAHPERYQIATATLEMVIEEMCFNGLGGIERRNGKFDHLQTKHKLSQSLGSDLHDLTQFGTDKHYSSLDEQFMFSEILNKIANSN